MGFSNYARWGAVGFLGLLLGLSLTHWLRDVDQLHEQLQRPQNIQIFAPGAATAQALGSLPALLQNERSELREHRVRFEFKADAENRTDKLALFSPQIIHGGDFYVNGQWFYAIPASTPDVRRTWYVPLLAQIPPPLLSKTGVNQVDIKFRSYQRGFIVPSLEVGALAVAQPLHQKYLFVSNTLAQATNIFCWIVGLFMLSLWFTTGQGRLFVYSGGATVLWASLFTLALIPELDLSHWHTWRFLLYVSTGALVLLMSLFLLEFAKIKVPRRVMAGMVAGAVGAPSLFLVFGRQIEYWLDLYWTGLVILLYVVSIGLLVWRKYRRMDALTWALLGYSMVATVCAYHDYGVQAGSLINSHAALRDLGVPILLLEPIFLTHFTLPCLLIIVGVILSQLHAKNLHQIESANLRLESELRRREAEIERVHAEQRRIIAENAINSERSRILQDIHDGLGSRLVNLLLEARTGQIVPKNLPVDLQACLEDLRLLVSGQFIGELSFSDALEEFCRRAARNLLSVGIELRYEIATFEEDELKPELAIHTFRIIQEMVSNTIKHSNASRCEILVARDTDSMKVAISDNGQGFVMDANDSVMKRGLLGIQKRLNELKAQHKWTSNDAGTSLELTIKIVEL